MSLYATPSEYTALESYRLATFRAATRGLRAHNVAKALLLITRGIDGRGMGKRSMADEFARGYWRDVSGAALRDAVRAVQS